ncbi:hypothetical protein [Ulvibacterium sp.]|uniref:hypothetical protein n=1 Tax=Ulvibacterium sp. TaxID=2665914 RepID=UPI0026036B99|nr:hypothetical protein [Ulvibacterium sp.]
MRHLLCVLSIWLMTLVQGLGQVALKTNEQVEGYRSIPQERIFVHTNSSLLLTGEYLYYKVYCLERESGSLSKLSKMAYVELVGPGGNPIFKHKILLEKGMGYGDFFVPTDIRSGGYKLLAYTHWMRNQDQADFHQNDIAIINPYLVNQGLLQKTTSLGVDSLVMTEKLDNQKASLIEAVSKKHGPVDLTINGTEFKKRTKVSLLFKNSDNGKTMDGEYSISIRKKSGIPAPMQTGIIDFFEKDHLFNVKSLATIGDSIYLPELRGELFSGKVIALQGNGTISGLKVALCIPGEDYFFDVAETDEWGNFHLNLDRYYPEGKAILQVLSAKPEEYKVKLRDYEPLDYSKLHFKDIKIDSTMRKEILQRSIHNQIENSYFQFRPDSVLSSLFKQFSDNKEKEVYLLDDYTRFKTLRETIVEIINDVSSKRLDKDNETIRIKGFDYAQVTDLPPLILMDGCLLQDNNALLDFDARNIESIAVLRHKLVFGLEMFQGAMVIKTKTGDGYGQFIKDLVILDQEIFESQLNKKYFVQRYDSKNPTDSKSRLPDDRLQLLWVPSFNLTDERDQLDFFTSDVSGEFEIHLEGVTHENEPVSIRKSIYVD